MERHGISVHFRHAVGSDMLVLADDEIGARPFKRHDSHHQYEQKLAANWGLSVT